MDTLVLLLVQRPAVPVVPWLLLLVVLLLGVPSPCLPLPLRLLQAPAGPWCVGMGGGLG